MKITSYLQISLNDPQCMFFTGRQRNHMGMGLFAFIYELLSFWVPRLPLLILVTSTQATNVVSKILRSISILLA